MYVNERYYLPDPIKDKLHNMVPRFGYGVLGEITYYRTYSRKMNDGRQEHWADTVIRVIEGVMSIRYDWYKKNNINFDVEKWNRFADHMAVSLFNMQWMPPGRGLWAMGSNIMYERGSMPLYNCGFKEIGQDWIEDLCWIKDALMCGVGVGFRAFPVHLQLQHPMEPTYVYTVPDSREGWVDSVRVLLRAYRDGTSLPVFNYSKVRPAGSLIKGFGGTASGPEPLRILHKSIDDHCNQYLNNELTSTRFFTDIANMIGVCVVAGNIRRSAEIALGSIDDDEFMDLKDYDKYPDRENYGWMSNNSVILERSEDFNKLSEIASRVIKNGEPGYLNQKNLKYGRIGDKHYIEDFATGINPCGEIPLEDGELCNVADTVPTRCINHLAWQRACKYATFYTSTVSLLPTHHKNTNAVITRNRRIGVGIIDFAGWKETEGLNKVIGYMRQGYTTIKFTNTQLAKEAGVRDSIRVTTIKPGGTTTKLAGRQPGIGHPNYRYMLRAMRVQRNTSIERILIDANVPHEPCAIQPKFTTVFYIPVYMGETRTVEEVSLWEQAMNLVTVQREWADNAVSNTLVFKKEEEPIIEFVLSHIAPITKSVSLLRYTAPGDIPQYAQMPEQGITPDEYYERINAIEPIDWSKFNNSDGIDEKFCDGEQCVVPQ